MSEYPHIRRVGAYLFFGWLAFWSSMPVYAVAKTLEFPEFVRNALGYVVIVVTFLTLRDMTVRTLPTTDKKEE